MTSMVRNIGLIIIISCIVVVIECRINNRHRNEHLGEEKKNLCLRHTRSKLMCHCDNDASARNIDCWLVSNDISPDALEWNLFQQHHIINMALSVVDDGGYLGYLPSNAFTGQREMISLIISHANIREIPMFGFTNLISLQNITLKYCKIEIIHNNSFSTNEQLKIVNLLGNYIHKIGLTAFSTLINLEELILTTNNLTSISDKTFSDLNKLFELKLSDNLFEILRPGMFFGLGNLRKLDLSFNNIQNIDDTVFAELWTLHELDLSANLIQRLSAHVFGGLNNLKALNLGRNKLTILEPTIFSAVPALININLETNLLETLTYPNVMPLMDNLVNSSNSIILIANNSFICDCRLDWVYDLRERAKNQNLRQMLEEIKCNMTTEDNYNQFIENNQIIYNTQFMYNTQSRISPIHNQVFNTYKNKFERNNRYDIVYLRNINRQSLVCPLELSEPTEFPNPRESLDNSFHSGGAGAILIQFARFGIILIYLEFFIL